jgi:hypothetical protein
MTFRWIIKCSVCGKDIDKYDAHNEDVRSETEDKKHKNHQGFDVYYHNRPKECVPSPSSVGYLHYIRSWGRIFDNVKKRTRLLLSQLEKEKERNIVKEEELSIVQEIECPRCQDIMTLHSEFDRLGYYCEECSFSLHLSHWNYAMKNIRDISDL